MAVDQNLNICLIEACLAKNSRWFEFFVRQGFSKSDQARVQGSAANCFDHAPTANFSLRPLQQAGARRIPT